LYSVLILEAAYDQMPVPATVEYPFNESDLNEELALESKILFRHSYRWLLINGYAHSTSSGEAISDAFEFHRETFRRKEGAFDVVLTDKGILAIEKKFHLKQKTIADKATELVGGVPKKAIEALATEAIKGTLNANKEQLIHFAEQSFSTVLNYLPHIGG
jgi:hypothetical protein